MANRKQLRKTLGERPFFADYDPNGRTPRDCGFRYNTLHEEMQYWRVPPLEHPFSRFMKLLRFSRFMKWLRSR